MEIKAKTKFLRISPKKVRLVANLTKGLDVEEALTRLQFLKKQASGPVIKLIKSAISNAEENLSLKRNNLFIKEIKVDGGPTLYRFMPRAMGRATPIRKRSSHISLILAERVPTEASKAKKKEKEKEKEDEIIKVDNLKEFDFKEKAETKKEEKIQEGKKSVHPPAEKKSTKGFVRKIFSRKTG